MDNNATIISFESRTEEFIDKEIAQLKELNAQSVKSLESFSAMLREYQQAMTELIDCRKQYMEVLKKYEEPPATQPFPGVANSLPSYNASEMTNDTENLEQLAELVMELEGQVEILEHQLHMHLKNLVTTINNTVESSSQVSSHMEQFLTGLESPYDAGGLGFTTTGFVGV